MTNNDPGNQPHAKTGGCMAPLFMRPIRYLVRKRREKRADKKNESTQDRAARRTARATVWIATFTIVLAISGGFQVWVFIQSERSFVAPNAIKIADGELAPNKRLGLVVQFQNSGKATAFVIKANITPVLISGNPLLLPKTPAYLPVTGASGPVAAGGFRDAGYHEGAKFPDGSDTPFFITQQVLDGIGNGTIKFYVYGFVTYSDVFTIFGPRTTGYCYVYDPNTVFKAAGIGIFPECDDEHYVYTN